MPVHQSGIAGRRPGAALAAGAAFGARRRSSAKSPACW